MATIKIYFSSIVFCDIINYNYVWYFYHSLIILCTTKKLDNIIDIQYLISNIYVHKLITKKKKT